MIPTLTELTDTELDAVSGGLLDNLNIAPQLNITTPQLNITSQINLAVPTGVAVGVFAAAAVQQALGQENG